MSEATSGGGVRIVPGFRFAHPGYDFISGDEMQAGIHPHQFAGHVA